MRAVFADTSFYLAVLSPRDLAHAQALQVVKRLRRPLLLTDFVLLELGNALSAAGRRELFSRACSSSSRESQRANHSRVARPAGSWVRSFFAACGQESGP